MGHAYQLAKNAFGLSTMLKENYEIYLSRVAKNPFKLSIMVGENFEIYSCQVAKNAFKLLKAWRKL